MQSRIQVNVPERESGDWYVQRFIVTEQDAFIHNVRAAIKQHELPWETNVARPILPGRYTSLVKAGQIFMSDTPAELKDHEQFAKKAYGNVLITGLGLGVIVKMIWKISSNVESITILENSSEVIEMVAPYYMRIANILGMKLTIVEADAFTWKPEQESTFDCAWHDIWPTISDLNLDEIINLHKRHAQWVKGFQMSWAHKECEDMKRLIDTTKSNASELWREKKDSMECLAEAGIISQEAYQQYLEARNTLMESYRNGRS